MPAYDAKMLADALSVLSGGLPADIPPARSPVSPDAREHSVEEQRLVREIRAAARERLGRKAEALALYEPLPLQDEFHQCMAPERIVRGSNRAGKTLCSMVELARAVTGQDPYGKYPRRDGLAYAVGLDLMHVGQVLFRKLVRPGAFRLIKDPATGRWRAWRPWSPDEYLLKAQTRPAPPLIPARFIESIAWEEKGKGIPKQMKFTTGWELNFFSSKAKPPQGMALDICTFDEEIEDGEWYAEMAARLLDKSGRFWWSATPQAGNEQLLLLSERAAAERHVADPVTVETVLLLDENPFIDTAEKKKLARVLTDDDAAVRIGGEFAASRWKVYPEFTPSVHLLDIPDVPQSWTRYAAIDPGRQVCAVLFGAVPPPGHPEFDFDLLLYDELYIREASAATFGERMMQKCEGQQFEAFAIDMHMGRQHEMGSGLQVQKQYSQALKQRGVLSRKTKHGFVAGLDDVEAGVELCRDYLRLSPRTGKPRVMVRKGALPNFQEEIKRYRYKRLGRVVTDKPEDRGNVHLMAGFRYIVGMKPRHVAYKAQPLPSPAYQQFLAKQRRMREALGGTITLGPSH